MSGYVRIHRSLLGHAAFTTDGQAMAFAWLIAKAAWRPTKVRYKDRSIVLERGQVAVSVRDMAEHLDRDRGWVERLWKRLKSETMIETTTVTGVSVITICNYSTYQADLEQAETADKTVSATRARQGHDRSETQNKEEKNNKKIKKESAHARPQAGQPAGSANSPSSAELLKRAAMFRHYGRDADADACEAQARRAEPSPAQNQAQIIALPRAQSALAKRGIAHENRTSAEQPSTLEIGFTVAAELQHRSPVATGGPC